MLIYIWRKWFHVMSSYQVSRSLRCFLSNTNQPLSCLLNTNQSSKYFNVHQLEMVQLAVDILKTTQCQAVCYSTYRGPWISKCWALENYWRGGWKKGTSLAIINTCEMERIKAEVAVKVANAAAKLTKKRKMKSRLFGKPVKRKKVVSYWFHEIQHLLLNFLFTIIHFLYHKTHFSLYVILKQFTCHFTPLGVQNDIKSKLQHFPT